jgi:hypothetical protein
MQNLSALEHKQTNSNQNPPTTKKKTRVDNKISHVAIGEINSSVTSRQDEISEGLEYIKGMFQEWKAIKSSRETNAHSIREFCKKYHRLLNALKIELVEL